MIAVNGLPQVNCKWSYFLHQSTNWMLLLCLEYDSAHHMSLFVMVPRLSKYKPVPHGDVPHHNNNIYTRHCPEYNGNWRVGGPIIATFSTYNNMFLQVRGRGVDVRLYMPWEEESGTTNLQKQPPPKGCAVTWYIYSYRVSYPLERVDIRLLAVHLPLDQNTWSSGVFVVPAAP